MDAHCIVNWFGTKFPSFMSTLHVSMATQRGICYPGIFYLSRPFPLLSNDMDMVFEVAKRSSGRHLKLKYVLGGHVGCV